MRHTPLVSNAGRPDDELLERGRNDAVGAHPAPTGPIARNRGRHSAQSVLSRPAEGAAARPGRLGVEAEAR